MNSSKDSQNTAMLVWIGTIFFGFIPSLIVYLIKKDDAYILAQSKEALNWSITTFIICAVLAVTVVGIFLLWIIGICNLIFCIMGAVATSKGEYFKAPFAIRLIK